MFVAQNLIESNSGCSSVGRTPALGAGGRRFEPCYPDKQWDCSSVVERRPEEPRVGGSIPSSPTKLVENIEMRKRRNIKRKHNM